MRPLTLHSDLKMKNEDLIQLIICMFLFVSCMRTKGDSHFVHNADSQNMESDFSGTYQAILNPLNKNIAGYLNGSLTVAREKDDVYFDVRFSNGPASSIHSQNIHLGERCPTDEEDLNHDGYIDAEEISSVVKEILIPLDDDVTSQRMGLGTFPFSDEFGNYFWSRETSFEKLITDLREEDINLKDEYAKLGNKKSLSMLGMIIVIRGVAQSTTLPETVSGKGRLSAQQGIPIACGVIQRLSHAPGEIDQDRTNIPLPINGETVGGSGGADDGANFPSSQTTTGGNTGNYGDDDNRFFNES